MASLTDLVEEEAQRRAEAAQEQAVARETPSTPPAGQGAQAPRPANGASERAPSKIESLSSAARIAGVRATPRTNAEDPSQPQGASLRAPTIVAPPSQDDLAKDEWNRRTYVGILSQRMQEWDREARGAASLTQAARQARPENRGRNRVREVALLRRRQQDAPGTLHRDVKKSSSPDLTSEQNPYMEELQRLLGIDTGGGPQGANAARRNGNGTPDWMPQDTSEDANKRLNPQDFFSRGSSARSNRFSGGYLSDEFRNNFIESHMEGLAPGDQGYEAARQRAEGAWKAAERQYDQKFRAYGKEQLAAQTRRDAQQAQKELASREQQYLEQQRKQSSPNSQDLAIQAGDAKTTHPTIANRDLERMALESIRRSNLATGGNAKLTFGTGASRMEVTEDTTRLSMPVKGADGQTSSYRFTVRRPREEQTGGVKQAGTSGLRVGDYVTGGHPSATGKGGVGILQGPTNPTSRYRGQFDTVDESAKTTAGRYAGNNTYVFGDSATFEAARKLATDPRKRGLG